MKYAAKPIFVLTSLIAALVLGSLHCSAQQQISDRDRTLRWALVWTGDLDVVITRATERDVSAALSRYRFRAGRSITTALGEQELADLVREARRYRTVSGFADSVDVRAQVRLGLPQGLISTGTQNTTNGTTWTAGGPPVLDLDIDTFRLSSGTLADQRTRFTTRTGRSLFRLLPASTEPDPGYFFLEGRDAGDFRRTFLVYAQADGSEVVGVSVYYNIAASKSELRRIGIAILSSLAEGLTSTRALPDPFAISVSEAPPGPAPAPPVAPQQAPPPAPARPAQSQPPPPLPDSGASLPTPSPSSPSPPSPSPSGSGPSSPSSPPLQPASPATPPPDNQERVGLGFTVSRDGWVLTSAHIIRNCETVLIDDVKAASKREIDGLNGLGLVRYLDKSAMYNALPLAGSGEKAAAGAKVYVPAAQGDAPGGRSTTITDAPSGSGNTLTAISDPVPLAMSGAPLISEGGRVLGVLNAKPNLAAPEAPSDPVSNAVVSTEISRFLSSRGVVPESAGGAEGTRSTTELEDAAKKTVHRVTCKAAG